MAFSGLLETFGIFGFPLAILAGLVTFGEALYFFVSGHGLPCDSCESCDSIMNGWLGHIVDPGYCYPRD